MILSTAQRLKRTKARHTALEEYFDSQGYREHFEEIQRYFCPRRGRYLSSRGQPETDRGSTKHQSILNPTGSLEVRDSGAGLVEAMTSATQPWFELTLRDKDLAEWPTVSRWLHAVRDFMLDVFVRSGFYAAAHAVDIELLLFGTAPMLIDDDWDTYVRWTPLTAGEYTIALGANRRPMALYRRFTMAAWAIAQEFGEKFLTETTRRKAKSDGETEEQIMLCQAIQPRQFSHPHETRDTLLPWESLYWESEGSTQFLREAGYSSRPFVAPRWDVVGSNVYGESPAMLGLGDVKQLQEGERLSLKAQAKLVDPPTVGPMELEPWGIDIRPAGQNFISGAMGSDMGVRPLHEVHPNLDDMETKQRFVEARLRRTFFNDFFYAVINADKAMTATELIERHTERLRRLGPVVHNIQADLLDGAILRTFEILAARKVIPPPPAELQEQEFKIEYLSLLARAQRQIASAQIDQITDYAIKIASAEVANGQPPLALDKINTREAVDAFARSVGGPPAIIRSNGEVAEVDAARMQQQQMAQAQSAAAQAAETGKTLSETKLGEGSALDRLVPAQR